MVPGSLLTFWRNDKPSMVEKKPWDKVRELRFFEVQC
jgi:hypothetical protein